MRGNGSSGRFELPSVSRRSGPKFDIFLFGRILFQKTIRMEEEK